MELDQFIAATAAVLSPVLLFCIYMSNLSKHTNRMTAKLLDMHEHPENTGFGTVGHVETMRDNTRALKELSHYVQWIARRAPGEDPPPPYLGGET